MKYIKTVLAWICCAVMLCGCANTSVEYKNSVKKTGMYFDTVVEITLYDGDADDISGAFEICKKYEDLLSRTKDSSEIYKLNHADGKPVQVSAETASLLSKAFYYSRKSSGAFDLTICPLTDLWNFTSAEPKLPSQEDVDAALKKVSYLNVKINGDTIALENGAEIDLGGIAKGYIADRLNEYFVGVGVKSGIINLGGNIYCIGSKTDGSNFTIGIKNPKNTNLVSANVEVSDMSVVTSGPYERCFTVNGTIYHHILNTQSGFPASSDMLSATVITKNSTDADALSTICYLYGIDKATELIENTAGTEAVFIKNDSSVVYTSGVGGDGIPIKLK